MKIDLKGVSTLSLCAAVKASRKKELELSTLVLSSSEERARVDKWLRDSKSFRLEASIELRSRMPQEHLEALMASV